MKISQNYFSPEYVSYLIVRLQISKTIIITKFGQTVYVIFIQNKNCTESIYDKFCIRIYLYKPTVYICSYQLDTLYTVIVSDNNPD